MSDIRSTIIVLIEDNDADEALTLRALRRNHITNDMVVLRDGQEALDYFFGEGAVAAEGARARVFEPDRPYLVLLDLKLPKVGGLTVLQRLRTAEATALFPVVILTSSDDERDLVDGYGLGANSYIRKPIDFPQFASVVQQIGAYWLILNEAAPHQRRAAVPQGA